MPTYSYKAADGSGKVVKGSIEAAEEKGVVVKLQDMGYIPIRINLTKGASTGLGLDLSKATFSFLSRVTTKDVMVFTQDLSALLEAGLPVDRALTILIDVTENDRFKEIVREILKSVQGGSYLSDALGKYPKIFPTLYVNMVRAGETGGVLDAVLERLAIFLESSQELKDFIKSAMVYPMFLVFVGGLSIIVMMTYVIPKFSIIFSDMGQAMPLSTRILLGVSDVFRSYWWAIFGGMGAGCFLVRRYMKTPAGRMKTDEYKMNAPVVGQLVRRVEVARFARTLGTLTRSGVPILQALSLVKEIVRNRVIRKAMEKVYDRVKEGERLSGPLGEPGIFPSLAIQMITVGEETGRLDEMLLRVAENYEKMVRNMVKRLINLLEPVMILAMGLVVGFIVISMLMAVFSMNEIPF